MGFGLGLEGLEGMAEVMSLALPLAEAAKSLGVLIELIELILVGECEVKEMR